MKKGEKNTTAAGGIVYTHNSRLLLALSFLFTCIYLIWRVFYTIPFGYGWVSLTAGIALLIAELLGAVEACIHYFNMSRVEEHPVPEVPLALFPDVDVFIATYSESKELLYKTVNGCLHMDYPDKSKVHIYLCDDSRRAEIRELAEEMGVYYLDRPNNEGAKAGNLNHAMATTSSPLIATFDADMIPKHDFLMRTVPYFVEAEIKNEGLEEKKKRKLGFVQTPQSFYNPDLFQFNLFSESRIPNEQDYFYKDVQVSRNKTNSVIYGGSNTLLSREALEAAGGFYTKAITEDFATGILIQKKGYVCYATNVVLASGLSAPDLKSLIQQRIRWGRGVISTGRKMHIFCTPHLSVGQKVNYWASIWYWYAPWKRLIYIMSPILFATFGYLVLRCTLLEILAFWLPMYVTSNLALRLFSRNIRTTKWTGVYETALFPFMLVPTLLETFGISLKTFKVTSKATAENERGKNLIYSIPFLVLIVLSLIGIVNCIRMMLSSGTLDAIILIFWLSSNMFSMIMAVFFVQGRTLFRKNERVRASIDCVISDAYQTVSCKTMDLSETGVSIVSSEPLNLDDKGTYDLELDSGRYQARLQGSVMHVSQYRHQWKYAFRISGMYGSYPAYLQMLYDRVPTLPITLEEDSSSFDDLRINVSRRAKGDVSESRKLPRLNLGCIVQTAQGQSVHVVNFNFKFIVLQMDNMPNYMKLLVDNGLVLDCAYTCDTPSGRMYSVENYAEIQKSGHLRMLMSQWLAETVPQGGSGETLKQSEQKERESNAFKELEHV